MTDEAAVVPAGERADLQRTAQETGERFGRHAEAISNHDEHFRDLNGGIKRIDDTMHTMSVSLSLLTAAVAAIEKRNADAARDQERNADRRERVVQQRRGLSVQWQLAIFAAILTVAGFMVTVVMTLVVLYANGKL